MRELANAIERAVVMSTNGVILVEDLPESVSRADDRDAEAILQQKPDSASDRPLREVVGEFESQVIHEALARNGGNRARTAIALGISRRALLYKLQEYGIGGRDGGGDGLAGTTPQ